MTGGEIFKLIASVAVCEGVGVTSSLISGSATTEWYASLSKPGFQPPGWVFGPMWTMLYVLMGVAAFLVWRRGWAVKGVKIALLLFAIQLVLNGLWSIIFFRWHSLAGAMVEIGTLWAAILVTIVFFARVSKTAAGLLVPYLLWVSFAAVLTFEIWRLNS
jgi:tryptophan-rich sensory protein